MNVYRWWQIPALAVFMGVCLPQAVSAHPHIFADARLEIETSPEGRVTELRNVWRFDEGFSSSVIPVEASHAKVPTCGMVLQ